VELLNLRLMSHPINWLLVWVILALVSLAYTLIWNGVQDQGQGSVAEPINNQYGA
jgi:hypothetical protein